MARARSPRGRNAPTIATRVSAAEKEWFIGRAARLGVSPAQLQRDRLLFDMVGYERAGRPLRALAAIAEALWPEGNPDHQWSADTLDQIARAVDFLRPRGNER